jgi:hypothetical protein
MVDETKICRCPADRERTHRRCSLSNLPITSLRVSPSVNSFNSSIRSQSPTPDLVLIANSSPVKETDRYAYLDIEETASKHSSVSEKQVEQAVLCDHEDTPLANGLDSSGETLVEDTSLPAVQEEPR